MDDQVKYRQARERISTIKGFYIHGLIISAGDLGLARPQPRLGQTLLGSWVLLGRGVGVALHAALVFGGGSSFLAHWEQRKIKELMAQDDRRGVGGDHTGKPAS